MIAPTPDKEVDKPPHYMIMRVETQDMLRVCLDEYKRLNPSASPWELSCFSDALKYRFRVGKKNNDTQDIAKAMQYEQMGLAVRKPDGVIPAPPPQVAPCMPVYDPNIHDINP